MEMDRVNGYQMSCGGGLDTSPGAEKGGGVAMSAMCLMTNEFKRHEMDSNGRLVIG